MITTSGDLHLYIESTNIGIGDIEIIQKKKKVI